MKTILITGATDGIGKATAKKFLSQNWKVILVGRNPQKVDATTKELQSLTGKSNLEGICADLSLMAEVKKLADKFLKDNQTLDVLLLNANAISNQRILTQEGNEHNFALGYLSRVFLINLLQETLNATPKAQILSVVGRDYSPLDFNDLSLEKDFSGRKALTRWQWAINLYLTDYAKKNKVLANCYMPGLVKTKILANEPQPMRMIVQLMNKIIGISTEKSAENIYSVVNEISTENKQGKIFAWKTDKGSPIVKRIAGDIENLLSINKALLP